MKNLSKQKIIYKEGEILGECIFLKDLGTIVKIDKKGRVRHRRYGVFQCKCGKDFEALIESVKFGKTRSCGCLFIEECKKRLPPPKIIHGESMRGIKSPEYIAWLGMKSRCKEDCISRKWYFDKNITVCEEWEVSFEKFLEDVGRKPTKYHSIDRIDSNKGYFKENCKWSTAEEQSNNISHNVNITFNNVTQSASKWAREIDVSPSTILKRIKKGWPIEVALTKRTKP